MQLDQFLEKRNIILSPAVEKVCREGIERMRSSKDPHHSDRHVYGLLDELDSFLDNEKIAIDFSVMIPAVCWHDVWKSTRQQSTNIPLLIFEQLYDGFGSAKEFKRYAQENALTKKHEKAIIYCILKHSQISYWLKLQYLFAPKTLEARVMRDIDELDRWSLACLNHLKQAYIGDGRKINTKVIPVAKWWFFNVIQKSKDTRFYFRYSKKEFLNRKSRFIKEIYEVWNDRYKYVDDMDVNNKYLEDPRMQE